MPSYLRISNSAARAVSRLSEADRRVFGRALEWLDIDPTPNGVSRREMDDLIVAVYFDLAIAYRSDPDGLFTIVQVFRYIDVTG